MNPTPPNPAPAQPVNPVTPVPDPARSGDGPSPSPATTFPLLVSRELSRARSLVPRGMHSLHEAYAVLLEEVDELWDEVRKKRRDRNVDNVLDELVQIAAMAQRTAEDVIPVALAARAHVLKQQARRPAKPALPEMLPPGMPAQEPLDDEGNPPPN